LHARARRPHPRRRPCDRRAGAGERRRARRRHDRARPEAAARRGRGDRPPGGALQGAGDLAVSVEAGPKRSDRGGGIQRGGGGKPLASHQMEDTLLRKLIALPVFASDPLSSVAYATEAALVVLLAASAGAAHFVIPVSIAIALLLAIVVLSYRQTVRAYESSGGAYLVAKENLGTLPS